MRKRPNLEPFRNGLNHRTALSCCLLAGAITFVAVACASVSNPAGFDAYGFLSPNLSAKGDFIGNFPTRAECEEAGEAWMSQQVVGNPVRAECYPAERR